MENNHYAEIFLKRRYNQSYSFEMYINGRMVSTLPQPSAHDESFLERCKSTAREFGRNLKKLRVTEYDFTNEVYPQDQAERRSLLRIEARFSKTLNARLSDSVSSLEAPNLLVVE